jgi:hypothetical protein
MFAVDSCINRQLNINNKSNVYAATLTRSNRNFIAANNNSSSRIPAMSKGSRRIIGSFRNTNKSQESTATLGNNEHNLVNQQTFVYTNKLKRAAKVYYLDDEDEDDEYEDGYDIVYDSRKEQISSNTNSNSDSANSSQQRSPANTFIGSNSDLINSHGQLINSR